MHSKYKGKEMVRFRVTCIFSIYRRYLRQKELRLGYTKSDSEISLQFRVTVSYHCNQLEGLQLKILTRASVGKEVQQMQPILLVGCKIV